MKLVLFDIDGTLLRTHGIGRGPLERVLSTLTGRAIDTAPVRTSGKTDPQVVAEVLSANGVSVRPRDPLVDEALAAYGAAMIEAITPHNVHPLPGIDALIPTLAEHDEIRLGLVTGNLEPVAYCKLEAVGLAEHFPFGAFGSDHADRHRLPPIAVERAWRHTGRRFHGTDVVIVGDTEHDIGCGRSVGAFCVAVCTGNVDRACLMAHEADALFERLDDPEVFLATILRS